MSTPKISRARVAKRRDRPTFFFVLAICLLAGALRSTKSGVSANSGVDKYDVLRETTTRGESLGSRTSTAAGVEDEGEEEVEEPSEEVRITTEAPKEEDTARTTTASIAATNKTYSPFASMPNNSYNFDSVFCRFCPYFHYL